MSLEDASVMVTGALWRWPTQEQIAETIIFLASPGNRVTHSAVVPVYGRS